MTPVQMVTEFRRTFNLPVGSLDPAVRKLNTKLTIEEIVDELQESCDRDLPVPYADVLVDIGYFAIGAAVGSVMSHEQLAIGMQFDDLPPFQMAAPAHPDGFDVAPEVRQMATKLILNVVPALQEACNSGNLDRYAQVLGFLLGRVMFAAEVVGIDFLACFEEVHRSNMSKLGADGKPIYRDDGKVLKGPGFFEPDLRTVLLNAYDMGVAA